MSDDNAGIPWFDRWLDQHRRRFPHANWARLGKDFFAGWTRAFDRNHVSPVEALDATARLQEGYPEYPEHHLPAILAAIQTIRREREYAQQEQARQHRLTARSADQERLSRARQRFDALPEPDRAALLDQLAAANPGLARLPRCLETLALHTLAES